MAVIWCFTLTQHHITVGDGTKKSDGEIFYKTVISVLCTLFNKCMDNCFMQSLTSQCEHEIVSLTKLQIFH